jgi:hypothetical protein
MDNSLAHLDLAQGFGKVDNGYQFKRFQGLVGWRKSAGGTFF